ncbi:hypothetical protein Sango_3110700, partial [Sesamum angolense]
MHANTAFKIEDDKIAAAFHKSSRKTLNFIPPSMQNGEVIVRPPIGIIRAGSQRWNTTAVGYFLGKKLYFHHLNEFVRSIWPAVCEVKATSNGFFFFQFENVAAIEEVIESGPWLYLGQPIVLQKWEPGMVLRKLKHTEVPIWIKLRHLPVELWMTEGLSTVASGIGRPLYPDAITRACTRRISLVFALCLMSIRSSQNITGIEVDGKSPRPQVSEEIHHQPEIDRVGDERLEHGRDKGKDIVLFNAFDLLRETDDDTDGLSRVLTKATPQTFPHVEYSDMECSGTEQEGPSSCSPRSCKRIQVTFYRLLETRVLQNNVTRIQSGLLSRWRWFVDYAGPGNRIWIAWNDEFIDVDILNADSQFVHCRVHVHELHETFLLTVVYGANEVSARRELWQGLIDLAITVGNEPC